MLRANYAANGKILVSQKKAKTRPNPPITIPTLSISLVLIRPVENAIAFGGVEIGIHIASEAHVATKQIIAFSPPPNAIAFSTGLIKTKDMLKVGIVIGGFGLVFAFFWLTKIFPFAA